jgi:hypothetical protein
MNELRRNITRAASDHASIRPAAQIAIGID